MELFLPSLAVIFFVTIILFMWLPKLTPIIMAALALALLVVGIYHHWQLFSTEYRLSTWQETLKLFAPGIFIGVTFLFIIYSILAVFTGGEVPVPNISMPPVAETITAAVENVKNAVANVVQGEEETPAAPKNNNKNAIAANKNNQKGNNLSRSFLEVI